MNYLTEVVKSAIQGGALPSKPEWNKWLHQNLSENHCAECLKLDGCWFEKQSTPMWPHIKYTLWREITMKYLDCVEVTVEKEAYAKEGVHKGMQGVIWLEESTEGEWDVFFPQYGDKEDIAEIPVKEEDLVLLPYGMDAKVNEKIKEQFGD